MNTVSRESLASRLSLLLAADPQQVKSALRGLKEYHQDLFHQLFWIGTAVPKTVELRHLAEHGIIREENGHLLSDYQVWCEMDLTIITDRPEYRYRDRVFPIFSDENILLRDMCATSSGVVADIGTGSGYLGICAALQARRIVATEISQRALKFAFFNARINGVEDKVEIQFADVLPQIDNEKYDLIVSNPPFAPTPAANSFHLAGNGGFYGTDVIQKIIALGLQRLRPDGCLVFTALSLNDSSTLFLEDIISKHRDNRFTLRAIRVYEDDIPLSEYCNLFMGWPGAAEWQARLKSEGFTSISYLIIIVGPRHHQISQSKIPHILHTSLSGSWDARFARYRKWISLAQIYGDYY